MSMSKILFLGKKSDNLYNDDTRTSLRSILGLQNLPSCLSYNQLLRFPLTSEHDDAPDALEGAVQLARSSAQAWGLAVSGWWGRVLNLLHQWILYHFL